jgi:hypothetical protein
MVWWYPVILNSGMRNTLRGLINILKPGKRRFDGNDEKAIVFTKYFLRGVVLGFEP